jgi:hypothetical protein
LAAVAEKLIFLNEADLMGPQQCFEKAEADQGKAEEDDEEDDLALSVSA